MSMQQVDEQSHHHTEASSSTFAVASIRPDPPTLVRASCNESCCAASTAEALEQMNLLMEEEGNLRLPDDYTNRVLTDMVKWSHCDDPLHKNLFISVLWLSAT